MKKIRKAEAHCFTIKTAATAADTTPEVMTECLRKIGLRPDASGEINLSLLLELDWTEEAKAVNAQKL